MSQTRMARLPKNGICFFFSPSDLYQLTQSRGGKFPLHRTPSFSEVCISVWGYVLPLQTQPHWKMRLSTVHPMDNFGSAPLIFFQSSVCANNEQTVSMLDYLRKPRLEGSLQSFLNKLLVLSITAPTNNYNPQSSIALCFHSHVLLFPQKLLKSYIPIYIWKLGIGLDGLSGSLSTQVILYHKHTHKISECSHWRARLPH